MDQKKLPEIIRRRAANILKCPVSAVYSTSDEAGNIVTAALEDGSQKTVDIVRKKEVTLVKVSIEEDQTKLPDLDVPEFNDDIVSNDDLKEEAPVIKKTKRSRQTKSKK